ncbi:MAG: transglycosylase SLT domain-containing protein [Rikenellaceae bacterium]|nr:transglycosylase SLT domain-containing protein [Rikenellaceae bacterium]
MPERTKYLIQVAAETAGAVIVAIAIFFAAREVSIPETNPVEGQSLKFGLDFGHFKIESDILYAGLSYEMIQRFAEENGCEADIRAFYKYENAQDSLKRGVVDILVIPCRDSLHHKVHLDSLAASKRLNKEICWVARREDREIISYINSWLRELCHSEEFEDLMERFRFMPSSSRPPVQFREQKRLSPYDDIIKFRADSIGWDWRMLAAVIYTESKFAINVTSPVGARGLMQIMPLTARVYEVENPLDPEENIRAGASYLARLDKLFRKIEPAQERVKYVLGAYTAGESRILQGMQRMEMAARDSLQNAEIDSMVTAQVDSVKAADMDSTSVSTPAEQPKWITNANMYIDRVMKVYADFCRICPE